ncbi:hypothetical protein FA95DRAFT_1595418 [Auriscalpium vulgare]|uniref:Uncharacterized protein n=1 Tax=Auriscalpium vulgare TaxID=40419 RepID=A0ACB8RUU2_9AGAM|nr:hypothetical protein FA95DRAFT_1595418 [Auriscalpium vulgare]
MSSVGNLPCADDNVTTSIPNNPIVSGSPQLADIQCYPFANCLWTALSDSPELARIVRTLDIGDSDTVPRELIATQLATCMHCGDPEFSMDSDELQRLTSYLIVAALKNMSNLSTFKWNADPPEYPGCPQPWPVLAASCKKLRHVEVFDHSGDIWGSETLYLDFGAIHENSYPPADIGQTLLRDTIWPHLESLTLHGTMCAPADIVAFLKEHKGLRHLDIDRTVGCGPLWKKDIDDTSYFLQALEKRLVCPPGILPNLKTLACFPGQAVDILEAVFAGPRAVKSVELFLKDKGKEDDNPRSGEFREFAVRHTTTKELTVVRQEVSWATWEW